MKMFKKILLATDGSVHAKKAAAVAADLAATYRARLTIINVLPSSLSLEEIGKMPQAKRLSRQVRREILNIRNMLSRAHSDEAIFHVVPAFQSVRRDLSRQILDEAEQVARAKKVRSISRISADGDAAASIIDGARRLKSDLVVLGARGLGNFSAVMFGSVSRKVANAVKCPTLVVK
jgi:nucleotide-binding universal stress UspA family protein